MVIHKENGNYFSKNKVKKLFLKLLAGGKAADGIIVLLM